MNTDVCPECSSLPPPRWDRTDSLCATAFGFRLTPLPFWLRVFFLSSLFVLAASLAVSVIDLRQYEGIDFLQRYVGAKFGLLGMEPYHATADWWLNGIGKAFHETHFNGVPRPPGVGCNSPCLLLLYLPFTWLDFTTARYVSGALEWLAFLTLLCLMTRLIPGNTDRAVTLALALFFVAGAPFWRLHVERGQYYVFTCLLIASSLAAHIKSNRPFLSGLLLGLTVAIRPTIAFLALPFALQRRWRMLAGIVCACLLMGGASLAVFGVEGWRQFIWISGKYEKASTDFETDHFADLLRQRDPSPIQDFEHSRKQLLAPLPSVNSTAAGMVRLSKPLLDSRSIPVTSVLFLAKLVCVGMAVALILAALTTRSAPRTRTPWPFAYLAYAGIVAVNLVEYAIPYRAAYADIYYLLPVMLGIPIVLRERSVWLGVLLLVALASQQNLLGLVHGWYGIPVRVAGLTLFSLGVLWRWRQSIVSASSASAVTGAAASSSVPA